LTLTVAPNEMGFQSRPARPVQYNSPSQSIEIAFKKLASTLSMQAGFYPLSITKTRYAYGLGQV